VYVTFSPSAPKYVVDAAKHLHHEGWKLAEVYTMRTDSADLMASVHAEVAAACKQAENQIGLVLRKHRKAEADKAKAVFSADFAEWLAETLDMTYRTYYLLDEAKKHGPAQRELKTIENRLNEAITAAAETVETLRMGYSTGPGDSIAKTMALLGNTGV
jgi:hypothetical protein